MVRGTRTKARGYIPLQPFEAFDPSIYDSIRYDNDLRDSFPCIWHLLKDTLFNANQTVQSVLYDNFSIGQYNHTYFKVDWTMLSNSPAVAYTNSFGNPSTINDKSHWTDTILLNPYFLRRASKKAVIATALHEMLHAYINWCFHEYVKATPDGSGSIDSFYLKYYFPLHWQFFMNRPQDFFADTTHMSHQIMATNYINRIASVIYTFSNRNVPKSNSFKISGDTVFWDVEIFAELKNDSWAKKDKVTDTLLQHEQGHFDIAKLCAAEISKKLKSTTLFKKDYQAVVNTILKDIGAKYKAMEIKYDDETGHHKNREQQWKWNTFFKQQLNILSK